MIQRIAFFLGSVLLPVGCVDVVESEDMLVDLSDAQVSMGLSVNPETGDKTGRMTEASVQKDNGFRGIHQLKLYAMTSPVVGGQFDGTPNDRVRFIPITINAPSLGKAEGGIHFEANNTVNTEQATFVDKVSLPIGTNRCIGFGIANPRPFGKVDPVDPAKFFQTGVTLSHWNIFPNFDNQVDQLSDFFFGPRSIFPGGINQEGINQEGINQHADAKRLLCLINRPLQVNVNGLTWQSVAQEPVPEEGNAALKTTFEDYTKNRAGAFKNIKSLLESVYYQLEKVTTSGTSADYQNLAKEIRARILNPASPTSYPTGYTDDISFTIQPGTSGADVKFITHIGEDTKELDFPHALLLPDGATTLVYKSGVGDDKWPESSEPKAFTHFRFNENDQSGSVGLPVMSYAYPSELLYRVDCPIKASTDVHRTQWPDASSWKMFVKNNYTSDKLEAASKSIVLEKPMNYMVGCLETRAYLTANELPDGSKGGAAEMINVSAGFPIKGILVGMQNYIGWDGKVRQTPSGSTEMQYLTYDNVLAVGGNHKLMPLPSASPTDENNLPVLSYTLVLPSLEADMNLLKSAQEGVAPAEGKRTKQQVLLELENTVGDFHGHDNQVIAKGTRFYLVGELDLCEMYQAHANQFPTGKEKVSVFTQGVTTKAVLRVSSLAGAYNSIPDLRNPSLRISLQTSWNWQNGLIFDDNFGL